MMLFQNKLSMMEIFIESFCLTIQRTFMQNTVLKHCTRCHRWHTEDLLLPAWNYLCCRALTVGNKGPKLKQIILQQFCIKLEEHFSSDPAEAQFY